MSQFPFTLFVYGTLKQGFSNHVRFCQNACSICAAGIWGRLYHLSAGYPALELPASRILAQGSGDPLQDAATQSRFAPPASAMSRPNGDWDLIRGELITFPDPENDVPPIDWLEGYIPGDRSLYHRVLTVAWHEIPQLTWTYIAPRRPEGIRRRIGEWHDLERPRQHGARKSLTNLPEEANLYYFAYGSNMSQVQMRKRTQGEFVCIGYIAGFSLRFHKFGDDGHGKADAFETGINSDMVWGVLYKVSSNDIASLDNREGVATGHYKRAKIKITIPEGTSHGLGSETDAFVYLAMPSKIAPGLRPSPDYLGLVLSGAREHHLPAAYVEGIEQFA